MVRKVIAFDIGGTSIRVGVVQGKNITRFASVPTPKKQKNFLQTLNDLIVERLDRTIRGVGIAFPGQVQNGRVIKAPNVPLRAFDLARHLKKKFKVPVALHNDAGCVALAEQQFGCKKKNFIVITLGTGIGGGIVIKGEEYRGSGLGGELGHVIVNGTYMETHWQKTRKKILKKYHTTLMSDLIGSKQIGSKKIVLETTDYLGQGIASLITALDPEVVLLAGGVRECGNKLLGPIQKSVQRYTFLARKTPVVWTKLREPGVLGASLLVE